MRRKRKTRTKSVGWWKREADSVFSQYIRQKDAVGGIAQCVTCPNRAHWKKMQNGHYIPRNHLATRYHEKNCHVQCVGCNMFAGGRMDVYALFLINKYGKDILDELQKLKRTITKIGVQDYQEIIQTYKQKIKELTNT